MITATNVHVKIDLTATRPDLEPEELERMTQTLGQPLTLEFAANGKSYKLQYCNQQQLDEAVQTIERLAQIG